MARMDVIFLPNKITPAFWRAVQASPGANFRIIPYPGHFVKGKLQKNFFYFFPKIA